MTNFVFSPPIETNYKIVYSKVNRTKGSCYEKVKFKNKYYDNNELYPWIEIQCFSILKPISKKKIIVLRIINKRNIGDEKNTIIYSHENSTDLGLQFPFLIDLSTQLKVKLIKIFYLLKLV